VETVESNGDTPPAPASKRRRFLDRLLLVVEVLAVAGRRPPSRLKPRR